MCIAGCRHPALQAQNLTSLFAYLVQHADRLGEHGIALSRGHQHARAALHLHLARLTRSTQAPRPHRDTRKPNLLLASTDPLQPPFLVNLCFAIIELSRPRDASRGPNMCALST
jgi:hypothetical protein